MSHFQQTLANPIAFEGLGVHTGQPCKVVLEPADADSGIVFTAEHFVAPCVIGTTVPIEAMHATVLVHEGHHISTVEHLLAALAHLGVDNIIVRLEGSEVPILDGSSYPFVEGILNAGLKEQRANKMLLTPRQVLRFADDHGRSIVIEPAVNGKDSLYISYTAEFAHPLAGSSRYEGMISQERFVEDLAPARTFGFLAQLPFLRKHGLSQGASLGNTVVMGEEELMNDMRVPDEWVRHKALDLLGDLFLLGKRVVGKVTAHKTSHSFNRLVVKHYIEHPDRWRLISGSELAEDEGEHISVGQVDKEHEKENGEPDINNGSNSGGDRPSR